MNQMCVHEIAWKGHMMYGNVYSPYILWLHLFFTISQYKKMNMNDHLKSKDVHVPFLEVLEYVELPEKTIECETH
ncbi:hypothetical protein NQ318_007495 [Aromia moschata]|uniref:Uncharacterized protein n=1 Tax=Aromia moschata TaxID=1265417 RepID=A0AAV8YF48_9CUCU|nr:hypothetical protein NQ318_007495 [Aromia moschata]